jgi:MFS transporter, DHA1 family, multidrug resistance protein
LLAALAMLGPFAIDMYLFTFHAIGSEFAVTPTAVQQTLSTYLFVYTHS